MSKQISIIGCGWFGLPLAEELLKSDYRIKGTTQSNDKLNRLKEKGIVSFFLRVTENAIQGNIEDVLSGSDTLVLNIPPGLRKDPKTNYVKKIKQLVPFIEKAEVKQVILISSTSVFKDEYVFPLITQDTEPKNTSSKARQLIEVETIFLTNQKFRTTVLRFSGLIGADRHPAKMLAGKTNIKNPEAPVNLVHLIDCVGVVAHIIENNLNPQVFNLSYPYHPTRKVYYTGQCKKLSIPAPIFNEADKSVGKVIDSCGLEKALDYKFKMPI